MFDLCFIQFFSNSSSIKCLFVTFDLCPQAKEAEAAVDDGTMTPAPGAGGDKKLTNQFNYSERASQTYNNPLRVRIAANLLTDAC